MTQVLSRSDSFRGWVPLFPVVLIHNRNDDLVPAENSRIAYQHFREWGEGSVSLKLFSEETSIAGMSPIGGPSPLALLIASTEMVEILGRREVVIGQVS